MKNSFSIVLAASLLVLIPQRVLSATIDRSVRGNIITSNEMPRIRIKVDKAFKYVGHLQFGLKGIAEVERFVFAIAEKRHVKRLFIVQFEGFLEGNSQRYNYRMTNPVTFGNATYNQNNWFFDNAQNIKQNPGAESDQTAALLRRKGYTFDDELMMSRFVRVVDEAKRHEMIIYYIENLKDAKFSIAEYAGDGVASDRQQAIEKGLVERSLRSFTILD